MKKLSFRLLICIIIINIGFVSIFLAINGYCAPLEIDSEFGDAPIIDGYIDLSKNEWNTARKEKIDLDDLQGVDLWVMQNEINLFISVQFDLQNHEDNEFIGLIISNGSSTMSDEFIDAKIIQFTNKTSNNFDYLDYHINNSVFLNDAIQNGNGAAKIEGIYSTYEFSIPINYGDENEEDVLLKLGNQYAFNITLGQTPSYPSGIMKKNTVLINIKLPITEEQPLWDIIIYALIIVIFSICGILIGFYIIKIFRLKEKIERYKR